MKNRNLKSESSFINGASSLPKKEIQGRQRIYKAISASLTEKHIEMLDNVIKASAIRGHLGVTRSDVLKAAIEIFTGLDEQKKIQLVTKKIA